MLSARAVRINTDGPAFPAKTPGRDLRGKLENANAIATTAHRRGKNVGFPKTPLYPSSAQPKRLFKDPKSVLGTASRPLGDKTPLPNRLATLIIQSPSKATVSKASNLHAAAFEEDGDAEVLESMKRPSSLRKHLKLPRNSTQKNFETPINDGRHWDISDGDIDISNLQPVLQETKVVEDDFFSDEIEYCAPNTLDLPYQPPFDFELPDYTEVGKKIRDLAFSFPFDDAPGPPEPGFPITELEPAVWETFSLPPIESDDPFSLARLKSQMPTAPTSKLSQKPDLLSHRRVHSSLARLGSANSAMANRHKPTATSVFPKTTAATPALARKQPPKPGSNLENCTSKVRAPTRTVKSITIQKKSMTTPVQQTRTTQRGPMRAQTRPHTSLSLTPKNKGTALATKNNILSNPQILDYQVVDEDFMFDV